MLGRRWPYLSHASPIFGLVYLFNREIYFLWTSLYLNLCISNSVHFEVEFFLKKLYNPFNTLQQFSLSLPPSPSQPGSFFDLGRCVLFLWPSCLENLSFSTGDFDRFSDISGHRKNLLISLQHKRHMGLLWNQMPIFLWSSIDTDRLPSVQLLGCGGLLAMQFWNSGAAVLSYLGDAKFAF